MKRKRWRSCKGLWILRRRCPVMENIGILRGSLVGLVVDCPDGGDEGDEEEEEESSNLSVRWVVYAGGSVVEGVYSGSESSESDSRDVIDSIEGDGGVEGVIVSI
ncbi:hypothetical protein TWF594_010565 [Orbilia oligospora]|nr:hypothetical protein TWF706_007811 [Orbilia oligospora]KAF3129989.1 hypothetical protein TWF594_010565 [Orbilia oligospora]